MKHDLSWQSRAACRDIPEFLEDPKRGGWTDRERFWICRGYKIGQAVQPPCPVRTECLEYGMAFPLIEVTHRNLVFGGLTGKQVARLIRDRKKAA
jgi:hypothetical protein